MRWLALLVVLGGCGLHDYDSLPGSGERDGGSGDGGEPLSATSRIGINDFRTCAVTNDAALYCWGDNSTALIAVPASPTAGVTRIDGQWTDVTVGAAHICAVEAGGQTRCWGANDLGQLGTPSTSPSPPGEVVGSFDSLGAKTYDHTFAFADGRVFGWGNNGERQLNRFGLPGDFEPTPVEIETDALWLAIAGGHGNSCGVRENGDLQCVGRNTDSQSGLPNSTGQVTNLTTLASGFERASVGQNHGCAISASGMLTCWGNDNVGQLGDETGGVRAFDDTYLPGSDWFDVDVDTLHSCGLREPGTLWCWGRNTEGQLGLGNLAGSPTPTQVGSEDDWTDVAVGRFHSCGVRSDTELYCWGENFDGRLGVGDLSRRTVPTPVMIP